MVSLPAELVAAAVIVEFWSTVSSAIWIVVFGIVLIASNLFFVRVYGELEFTFASLKIMLIIGLNIMVCSSVLYLNADPLTRMRPSSLSVVVDLITMHMVFSTGITQVHSCNTWGSLAPWANLWASGQHSPMLSIRTPVWSQFQSQQLKPRHQEGTFLLPPRESSGVSASSMVRIAVIFPRSLEGLTDLAKSCLSSWLVFSSHPTTTPFWHPPAQHQNHHSSSPPRTLESRFSHLSSTLSS